MGRADRRGQTRAARARRRPARPHRGRRLTSSPGGSTHLWGAGEDERLGHAISLTLTHPDLVEADALAWIDAVARSWEDMEPGPPPAWVSNAARTLRVVVTMTLTGVRCEDYPTRPLRHVEVVRPRLLAALHSLTPQMW